MLTHLLSYSLLIIAMSCARRHIGYSEWDKSGNNKIDNYEFIKGYNDAKLFRRWAHGEFSFPAIDLTKTLFLAMDADSDRVIDESEFRTRSDYFHFGFTQPSFEKWDKNCSGFLEWNEFVDGGEEAIIRMWDFTGDGKLNRQEMADGIFLSYDKNHNGSWDRNEFEFWTESKLR
jgi:hypothetical protein